VAFPATVNPIIADLSGSPSISFCFCPNFGKFSIFLALENFGASIALNENFMALSINHDFPQEIV
jgi:hypothetical protein